LTLRTCRRLAIAASIGVACYALLLAVHVAKFGAIRHGVPNIAGWAGRYPGYGWTWDLVAVNLPADLFDRVAWRMPWLRDRGVIPQVVTGHTVHHDDPEGWRAGRWIAAGAIGYAITGAVVGMLAGVRRRATRAVARARDSP
jgi:hypothetical protein